MTVISCLESHSFSKKDFYRMDNYVLRLKPEAVKRLIDALRIRSNSPVRYKGRSHSWDTVIRLKAHELANHIMGMRTELDFGEPKPVLHRTDSEAIRSLILSLTTAEARKRGIRRNTFWYLQQRARTGKSLMIRTKVANKLQRHSLTYKE